MAECIFCKIVEGKVAKRILKETEELIVFKDINPTAPIHLLIVSKKHISDIREAEDSIWTEIKKVAIELARENKLTGFRLTHNAGDSSLIPHMHVHFLGKVTAMREV